MFSFDLARLPSFMNNMAQGVLKRLSTTVGYNMTCNSQEKVEKHLPEHDYDSTKSLYSKSVREREVSDNHAELQVTQETSTEGHEGDIDTPESKYHRIEILEKENIEPKTITRPIKSSTRNIALKSRGKVSIRDQYRATHQQTQKQHRREILRKIREGQARRNSWRPDQILKNRWAKMSQKERDKLVDRLDRLVGTGALKARDWLAWNAPKYTTKALYLILAGEVPEYANDAMKMCDLLRDMDRL